MVKADPRVPPILINNFEIIIFIMLWILDKLSKDKLYKPLQYWSALEHPFYLGIALIDSIMLSIIEDPDIVDSIYSRNSKFEYKVW